MKLKFNFNIARPRKEARRTLLRVCLIPSLLLFLCRSVASAQSNSGTDKSPAQNSPAAGQTDSQDNQDSRTDQASSDSSSSEDPAVTMFPHSETARYWISGQDNIIFQYKPSFHAPYSGTNSLHPEAQNATSNVSTLYLGYELLKNTEIFFDLEEASGGGISDALGLAGFVNLDVVRNPILSKAPYMARVMVRQIIPLSQEKVEAERGPLALATEVPLRRVEIRAGKMGVADFFDNNDIGSDSHFQFMNWTVDNNGAYDYAADTRGYTYGVMTTYYDRNWSLQFGEMLMPKIANGPDLVWNLHRAHAENLEIQLHPRLFGSRTTTIRLLNFVNHANMGLYKQAIENYLDGLTPTPEIDAHPWRTTIKYGFGVNVEKIFPHNVRAFARWGWNEGKHESFAYTECDETFAFGADVAGDRWHRKLDRIGAAFVSNGISAYHQRYLQLGGLGFILGDGGLSYGRENTSETYYNAHVWRGLFVSPNLQHVDNPGYNRVRGPVWVGSFRFHMEF